VKAEENQHNKQLKNEHSSKKRAIDQLAIGAIILLWGILMSLKQIGIIEKSVSTWPFALTAFGMLLLASGIYRLSRSS
jgi:hypothetical protein